jgi:serine/threonine-protein kinase
MLTDILAIFLQVADGLEYMHRHGLIHADMKPGNIVVSKGGEVKVIDLGQSCRIGAVKQRLQGTPDHLAPEQAECRRLDERTDIYNFSSSLYWTLTGKVLRTAYSGVNTVSRTLHNETEDPTAALASECPAPLAELIRQSLKTDPEARPPSMAGVATRLQNVYARMRAMEVAQRRARHDPNETDLIGTRR